MRSDVLGLLAVTAIASLLGLNLLGPSGGLPADWLATIPPWDGLIGGTPSNLLLGDPLLEVYPHRKFLNDEIQKGRLPLWNPLILGGHTAVAEPNGTAPFYPDTLPFAWTRPETALRIHIIIHLFVAAYGMYFLLRLWRAVPLAAVTAATVFCGASPLSIWRLYPNLFVSGVWLPALLACYEMSLRSRRRGAWIAAGAAALSLSILSNFVQWTLYEVILLGAYAFWHSARAATRREDAWRPLAHVVSIVMLGAALGAVQAVPFLELTTFAQRGFAKPYELLRGFSVPAASLLTALAPDFFGTPARPGSEWVARNYAENTVYWGFLPAILALGAPLWRRDGRVWFLWTLLLVAGSIMAGSPTLHLIAHLPFVNFLPHGRLIFIVCFCGAALTGLVLEAAVGSLAERRHLLLVGTLTLLALAIVAAAVVGMTPTPVPGAARASLLWAIGLSLGPLLAVAAAVAGRSARAAVPWIFVASIIVDLAHFDLEYGPKLSKDIPLFPVPEILADLPRGPVPARVAPVMRDNLLLRPNSLMALGLSELGGYASLLTHNEVMLIKAINGGNSQIVANTIGVTRPGSGLLDLAGVEYLVSRQPIDPANGLELVKAANALFLYRNLKAAPRAFVVKNAVVTAPDAEWSQLMRSDFSYCRFATIEGDAPPALSASGEEGCQGEAHIVDYTPDAIRVTAETPAPGLLVLTDSYYAGWTALVDGERRSIYRADGAFRGVWLSAGQHTVSFEFRPLSVRMGGAITLLAMAVAAWLLFVK
jgi:Bacterial membrane protein YfhO